MTSPGGRVTSAFSGKVEAGFPQENATKPRAGAPIPANRGGKHTRDREAGATLLELLIVVAILASVAALSLPRLGATASRISFQSSALQFAAALRAARSAAVWSNVEKTLTIDVERRVYWSDVQAAPRSVGANVSLAISGEGVEKTSTTTGRLRFRPDGSAGSATISLSDGQQTALVVVDWVTGATHVEWVR